MTPLPRPSVSPLPAYASIAPQRPESFAGALLALARWGLFNRQPKPTLRERQLAAAAIERLADELADEGTPAEKLKLQPKRPRRIADPR